MHIKELKKLYFDDYRVIEVNNVFFYKCHSYFNFERNNMTKQELVDYQEKV